jgi:hypothetical protein
MRKQVLPGAARAGAKVIAQEAKTILGPRRADAGGGNKVLIADGVKVRVRNRDDRVVARVRVTGPVAYVARWLEYGTDPHFISVDPNYRQGMTARRTNDRIRDGDGALNSTLIINGQPVGRTIFHPGTDAEKTAFLRPAADRKRDEATAAAQAYIRARVTRAGIRAADSDEDDE